MKKKIKIIVGVMMVLLIFLTGCSLNLKDLKDRLYLTNTSSNESEKLTPKQIMEKILDCFENKDTEGLKSLFSEKVKKSEYGLDKEISKAFDFFEGNVVSVGHIDGERFTLETREEYGITKETIEGTVDIEMDTGEIYRIMYDGWDVFKADETALGVNRIIVYKPRINSYDGSEIERLEIGYLYDTD